MSGFNQTHLAINEFKETKAFAYLGPGPKFPLNSIVTHIFSIFEAFEYSLHIWLPLKAFW
jgi:hypothetical protein